LYSTGRTYAVCPMEMPWHSQPWVEHRQPLQDLCEGSADSAVWRVATGGHGCSPPRPTWGFEGIVAKRVTSRYWPGSRFSTGGKQSTAPLIGSASSVGGAARLQSVNTGACRQGRPVQCMRFAGAPVRKAGTLRPSSSPRAAFRFPVVSTYRRASPRSRFATGTSPGGWAGGARGPGDSGRHLGNTLAGVRTPPADSRPLPRTAPGCRRRLPTRCRRNSDQPGPTKTHKPCVMSRKTAGQRPL
jgi:hypothetical protein